MARAGRCPRGVGQEAGRGYVDCLRRVVRVAVGVVGAGKDGGEVDVLFFGRSRVSVVLLVFVEVGGFGRGCWFLCTLGREGGGVV